MNINHINMTDNKKREKQKRILIKIQSQVVKEIEDYDYQQMI